MTEVVTETPTGVDTEEVVDGEIEAPQVLKSLPKPVAEAEENVLDLTALAPNRKLVKLPTHRKPEGETFELRLMDDFGIGMQQKLLNWSRTYERLFNSDEELSPEQETRLKFVLDSLFDVVLDAPKSVKAKMNDGIRSRVMMAFSLAPLMARQERDAKEAAEMEETSTQENSTSET